MSDTTGMSSGLDPAAEEDLARTGFWRKLRRTAGRVPFSETALAAFYSATDRATPLAAKATLFGALAYFVLPADVIPDLLPGIGFTDDFAVLLAAVRATAGSIRDRHRAAARCFFDGAGRT